MDWNKISENSASLWIFWIDSSQIRLYVIKILWWIAAIAILLLISKIIAWIVKKNILKSSTISDNKHIDKIASLIWNIVFYVMVIFSLFVGFEIMWFSVGLILWWISFWVWLAFKEILWNMIAGIMVLYTKEFKLWDIIEIKADQIYFWRIEEITIRYTIIRTLDLREVIIPNMTLISVPIKTFSSEDLVKLNFIIRVHYNSDIAKVIETITYSINSFEFVKEKENTKVFVTEFWSNSINLKCLFCFDPKCWLLTDYAIWKINEKINEEFNKNWITIPYNMVTLTFEKDKDKNQTINNLQN